AARRRLPPPATCHGRTLPFGPRETHRDNTHRSTSPGSLASAVPCSGPATGLRWEIRFPKPVAPRSWWEARGSVGGDGFAGGRQNAVRIPLDPAALRQLRLPAAAAAELGDQLREHLLCVDAA